MPTTVDFKDLTALIPLLAGIFTYFKTSHERLKRARRLAKAYGFGTIYSAANIWPHWIYIIATLLVMLSSVAYFAVRFFNTVALPYVGALLQWISANYYAVFLLWLLCVVLAFFQAIERLVLRVTGLFRGTRETVDWANANWHIREDSAQAPVLAPSQMGLTKISQKIVEDLIDEAPNTSLALRPPNLDNVDAANVLYFGHVIEEYAMDRGGPRFLWTPFYEALGDVAMSADRPFSSKALAGFDGTKQSFLNDVLLKMNYYIPLGHPELPNDATLEQRVSEALRLLQQQYRSDARSIAWGWVRFSYGAVLTNSRAILKHEGMRRQLAKLVMLWNVVDRLHRPKVFKVPLSGGIFLLYLNDEVLLTESDKFERNDPGVETCFECTQQRLMQTVLTLIDSSVDFRRKAWREAERQKIATRGADWKTWVLYRADQHSYHLGREAEQKPWKATNNGNTFSKSKS